MSASCPHQPQCWPRVNTQGQSWVRKSTWGGIEGVPKHGQRESEGSLRSPPLEHRDSPKRAWPSGTVVRRRGQGLTNLTRWHIQDPPQQVPQGAVLIQVLWEAKPWLVSTPPARVCEGTSGACDK